VSAPGPAIAPPATAPPATAPAETAWSESAVSEIGGRKGPEPTRFGDWELRGRCIDF